MKAVGTTPPRAPRQPPVSPQAVRARAHASRQSRHSTDAVDIMGMLAATRALTSQTSIEGLRSRAFDALCAMTGASGVHFLLCSGDERQWQLVVPASGASDPVRLTAPGCDRVPLSVVRYVTRGREPLVIADVLRDARFARDPYFIGLDQCSMLALPISGCGMSQALLLLENRGLRDAFSTVRLDGIRFVSAVLTISLTNALVSASTESTVARRTEDLRIANEHLRSLSITDPTTGLANRRRLEEVLGSAWYLAQRQGTPLAVAMIDIDHFKLYNDHYGHAAGDTCLRRVARQLERSVRDTDLAARYGGEEFAVVMPDTDVDAALVAAERLRAGVEALAEAHAPGAGPNVTVSIGIAVAAPTHHDTPQRLIESADAGLYQAKRSGRNRVGAIFETPGAARRAKSRAGADAEGTSVTTNTPSRDLSYLDDPLLNKGTAFTEDERTRLGLRGLIPPMVETLEQQVARAYQAFLEQPTELARHINLRALQDTNEVLFYRLLSDHVEEMLPIIYTPTVGMACERYSGIYRRPRGVFLSYPDRDRLTDVLRGRRQRDVDVVVVTDGERILGLGDQGAGGMGIAVGKLSLYTLLGGIHPSRTLPVLLDVGTDNPDRLSDPMYLGWRHERIRGAEYDDFVDRFVSAVKTELPGTLVQWEDLATAQAQPILDRYRDDLLTFNDDIQGTAAVTAGALAAAASATGTPMREQRVVMLGAGSAGIGVCEQIVRAMIADGLTESEARARVFLVDAHGLLTDDRGDLTAAQRRLATSSARLAAWSDADNSPPKLASVVANVRPTALLGLSAARGGFTRDLVTTMAAHVERPVIMPLSNPTSHCEAWPQDLADWTGGRALVATGSPCPPMRVAGADLPVPQCNNAYAFPGIGLGAVASRATRITDSMLSAASDAIARAAPIRHDPGGALLPSHQRLRDVAFDVAVAVASQAIRDGVAPADGAVEQRVRATRWRPRY